MNIKEIANKAIDNSNTLTDATNETKKRTAVAFINNILIQSGDYEADKLPLKEIDEAIEEVLNDSK